MSPDKRYSELLSDAIGQCKEIKTKTDFYTALGIKKAYFYDIIKGRVNPPPREKQLEIIRILQPEKDMCIALFESAAHERNELSADLYLFIDDDKKSNLRKNDDYTKFIDKIKRGEIENVR